MGQKLNRSHPSMFERRREHSLLKRIGSILLCVAVVAAGFFSAKWVTESQQRNRSIKTVSSPAKTPNQSDNDTSRLPADDSDVVPPENGEPIPNAPASLTSIRAFYLPFSALSADSLADSNLLHDARKAGFNAVVFDLKDAEGNLYYEFTSPEATKIKSYAANALTADHLSALLSLIRECGLHPIPRLYAFRDNAACGVLTDARISYVDNHSWAWYDGIRDEGAKKWLNPYSDAAQGYIQNLVCELKAQGASAIMLEGVQFPERLDKQAYLGEKAASVSKSDALSTFIEDTRAKLGEDCPLLLGCTAEGALGTVTKAYGGNPLTFGSAVVSPSLSTDITASLEKMILRTQVLEEKTTLAPTLPVATLSAQAVNEAIAACLDGGTDSFILYHPEGTYDFTAYTLP